MSEVRKTQGSAEAGELVGFGRLLRQRGVKAGTGQVLSYARAAAGLGPADAADLYWAGRITLVNRVHDLAVYDAAFDHYFMGAEDGPSPPRLAFASAEGGPDDLEAVSLGVDHREIGAPAGGDELPSAGGPRASSDEVLRAKNFDQWSEDEFRRLARLLPSLRPPQRRSRRTRPSPRGKGIDLRRSVRRSLRGGGELVELHRRRRVERPRPVVLIVDVSGSMAGFSRALVQFSYGMSRASQRVEVFCFGTRLTRLTDALQVRNPDAALEEAAERVVDWNGGTRIGGSLNAYVTRWGKHRFNRGAVVIICSDGLERGEPELLARAMHRLSRQARAVVWVNPLAGDPKFRPLARGLAAALPHMDRMIAGNNVLGLEELAEAVAALDGYP